MLRWQILFASDVGYGRALMGYPAACAADSTEPPARVSLHPARMLRQAGVKVNLLLRDEDLRTQLAEAAPAWEVERILACETPDQVSPPPFPPCCSWATAGGW